jgi:hypothetical protein
MVRLPGHYDGYHIVLDDPAPEELKPEMPVEIVVLDEREKALAERRAFLEDLWSRPLIPPDIQPGIRRWRREELYERGQESA